MFGSSLEFLGFYNPMNIKVFLIEFSNFNGSTFITNDIINYYVKASLNPQKRNFLNNRNCRGQWAICDKNPSVVLHT